MKLNNKGLELIKQYEGLKLKPYLDSVNVPTIGYGTTVYPDGKKVSLRDPEITKEKAEEFLKKHIEKIEPEIKNAIKVQLNDNQYSALVSFAYNLGVFSLRKSTLMVKLNESKFKDIEREFKKWVFAGGKKLKGLEARRQKEADLFNETEKT